MATCRAGLGLTVGSTSVWRLPATPGDVVLKVDRGVEVAVDDQAAGVAGEGSGGQREFGFHRLAGRACFGGGKPAVGDGECAGVPAGFVGELAAQFGEPGVGDVPGQAPVAQDPGDVEILDHDAAVGGGQAGGEFVQPVAAEV